MSIIRSFGIGNQTYSNSTTDSTVPSDSKYSMTTDYVKIADGVEDDSKVYLKFFLDAPSAQEPGTYSNNVSVKVIVHGESP